VSDGLVGGYESQPKVGNGILSKILYATRKKKEKRDTAQKTCRVELVKVQNNSAIINWVRDGLVGDLGPTNSGHPFKNPVLYMEKRRERRDIAQKSEELN
jgi:hypothetical protein